MIGLFDRLALPLLSCMEPENAHRFAVAALRLSPFRMTADDPSLAVPAFGIDFPNPLGMAAGFDKHGEVPDALLGLGFGFVEIGTVTPLPQPGNPRPRLFRLTADRALINRLGFNSDGADALLSRLAARADRRHGGRAVIGINIGANKDSTDRVADYARLIEKLAVVASYFSCNISSPNTPGLRNLQQGSAFDDLLSRVMEARGRVSNRAGTKPVLIKIAPDLTLGELDAVVAAARRHRVDGMIVGNTTVARPPSLRDRAGAQEAGGLSGPPLFPLATRMLAETYLRVENAFPLIGVGGIDSGKAALAKVRAGAALVQIYSALVFRGLALVAEIKRELADAVRKGGHAGLAELVGLDAAAVTREPWPL
ncbi:MAG TPA: quinone-dependent dihydroorotate dehydrogenase [Xanthobacteraceae bacterium]